MKLRCPRCQAAQAPHNQNCTRCGAVLPKPGPSLWHKGVLGLILVASCAALAPFVGRAVVILWGTQRGARASSQLGPWSDEAWALGGAAVGVVLVAWMWRWIGSVPDE